MQPIPPNTKKWLLRLLALFTSTCLALMLAEAFFRCRHLDRRPINQNLGLQVSDLQVYQVSDDPFLLYETRPGASISSRAYQVSIDAFGARGLAHPERKGPGATRIFFFGASTVFGAQVNDDETMPAVLERYLNQRAPDKRAFEVWNFACSGYMLPQLLRRARRQLARFPDVDILLLMNTNSGKRLFLGDDNLELALARDNMPLLKADPSLILEYFPPPPGIPETLYLLGMKHSAIVRTWQGNRLARRQQDMGASPYSMELSVREHDALLREAEKAGTEVVFAFYPRRGQAAAGYLPFQVPPRNAIDLQAHNEDPLFYEIHPPARYLALHATNLARALAERGFVQLAPAAPPAQ